jgi:hypothetical protein
MNGLKKDLRKFGLTVGIAFFVLSIILYLVKNKIYSYLLPVGIGFILMSFVAPFYLRPIRKIWGLLSSILSWFMTRLILSILFFCVVTPIGFILRLFGKQFLDLSWKSSQTSYWNLRDSKEFEAESYKKQF